MTANSPDVRADGRYSIKETSELLGISARTLRRYTDNGIIRCGRWKMNGRPFYTGREILRLWMAMY